MKTIIIINGFEQIGLIYGKNMHPPPMLKPESNKKNRFLKRINVIATKEAREAINKTIFIIFIYLVYQESHYNPTTILNPTPTFSTSLLYMPLQFLWLVCGNKKPLFREVF